MLGFRSALAGGVAGATPELAAGVFAGLGGAQGHERTADWAGGGLWIGRIGPIRLIAAALAQALGGELFAIAAAFDEGLLQRGDLAVEQELFEARSGDVDESQFGLRGGRGGTAAFGDVLATGTRGLHHGVDHARAAVVEGFAEPIRAVVDERGRLETRGFAVPAARAELFAGGGAHGVLELPADGDGAGAGGIEEFAFAEEQEGC